MTYRITLPTIGSGTDTDPIRVDLPSYQFVSSTPDGKYHTVDVPDDDVPDDVGFGPVQMLSPRIRSVDIRLLSARELVAWANHLDERYQEHSGRFRPKGQ